MTYEQKALCINTATRISAISATNATILPASGPTQTVFVVNVTVYASEPDCQPMPIAIQSCLPHIKLSFGPSLDAANCPDILVAIDTCAGIATLLLLPDAIGQVKPSLLVPAVHFKGVSAYYFVRYCSE